MVSPGGRDNTYSNFTTDGNARVHAGNNYNNHIVHNHNYTHRQRRSDETLRGSERHKVFVQAVVEGQLPRVRNFLRMGVDFDETGTTDLTVLHRAVLSGHEDVIEALIEAGADVNANSDDFGTPLCLAALKGMTATVVLLLRCRARATTVSEALGTALHCCILSLGNHEEAVAALISAGAPLSVQATLDIRWLHALCSWDGDDRNQMIPFEQLNGLRLQNVTPALLAIRTLQGNLLEPLLPFHLDTVWSYQNLAAENSSMRTDDLIRCFHLGLNSGRTFYSFFSHSYLDSCAAIGDLDGASLLIARGARVDLEVDTDGLSLATPLISAVFAASMEIVTLLLDNGASIDRYDHSGMTALHHAASRGKHHIVRLLCQRGATVDFPEHRATPLWYAACMARERCEDDFLLTLRTLIDAGADVNARHEEDGFTPLLALLRGARRPAQPVCLTTLLHSGAKPGIRASDGTSAFRLCVIRSDCNRLIATIGRGLGFEETVVTSVCADLDIARKDHEDANHLERRMLCLSARASTENLALVLSVGVDIDIKGPASSDWTAMHSAAQDGSVLAIERLLAAGASPQPYNDRGRTPLTVAVRAKNIPIVEALLQRGCDPHAKGPQKNAQSAMEAAQKSGGDILRLVEEAVDSVSECMWSDESLTPIDTRVSKDSRKSRQTSTKDVGKASSLIPKDSTHTTIHRLGSPEGTDGVPPSRHHRRQKRHPAFLIEYFESGKTGATGSVARKPSVRVRLAPGAESKVDARAPVSLTVREDVRRPVFSRRINVREDVRHPVYSRRISTQSSQSTKTRVASQERIAKESTDTPDPQLKAWTPRIHQAEDNTIDGTTSSEAEYLRAPSRSRSRSASQESNTPNERKQHIREYKRSSRGHGESSDKQWWPSNWHHLEDDTGSDIDPISHVPIPAPARRSFGSDVSQSSRLTDSPKLLEMVEDTIKRMILPEINAIREQENREKEETSRVQISEPRQELGTTKSSKSRRRTREPASEAFAGERLTQEALKLHGSKTDNASRQGKRG